MKPNKKNAKTAGSLYQGESPMEFVLDGYCGVYYGACPVMLATRAGELGEVQQCYGC